MLILLNTVMVPYIKPVLQRQCICLITVGTDERDYFSVQTTHLGVCTWGEAGGKSKFTYKICSFELKSASLLWKAYIFFTNVTTPHLGVEHAYFNF